MSKCIEKQDIVSQRRVESIFKANLSYSTISPRILVRKLIFFHQNIHCDMRYILYMGVSYNQKVIITSSTVELVDGIKVLQKKSISIKEVLERDES
jgi:hypothetical protein